MKQIKRVVLAGGGTGGHIYPALALLEQLKKENSELEVLYIGTSTGLEARIIPRLEIPFKTVEIQGIRRSLSLENFRSLWLMYTATRDARKILRDFQPDVVIGTGGYVAAPVLFAATREKLPTLIHEQNSVAGITNKFLARFVDQIAISFPEVRTDFKQYGNKVVMTGNPRSQQVLETPKDASILKEQFDLDPDKPTVLVFGGSRGAPGITKAALHAASQWLNEDFQVIISTGEAHFDTETANHPELFAANAANLRIVAYVDEMPKLFRAIDLVVCRSGATTLAELTGLGLPSILIPSPYVTGNHQEHNALSLVNNDAAQMIKESELTATRLEKAVTELMKDSTQLATMAKAAKALGKPDSADLLIKQIKQII